MKNQPHTDMVNNTGKIWAGLFLLAIGALLLLDNWVLKLPPWIFSWHVFLMAFGLFIGIKNRFRGGGWFVILLIGAFFTADVVIPKDFATNKILFPAALILLGLFFIFKPNRTPYCNHGFKRANKRWERKYGPQPNPPFVAEKQSGQNAENEGWTAENRSDFLESVNIFGGNHQVIYTKNFKGGDVVTIFGGSDLNMAQADFEGEIVLELTAVFGGIKMVIPPDWTIKNEIAVILGGVDDKRAIQPIQESKPQKILIIRGIAALGGIDIRNF